MTNLSQPYFIEPRQGKRHIDLCGAWDFGYMNDPVEPEQVEYSMQADVPGTVFWQLYQAGKMPNPYVGMNSKQFGWVDDKAWYYRKKFTLDQPADGRAMLCFDGSCYFTRVWLNGVLLGEHEGMFGGPICEVSRLLRAPGENELVAEVRACNYRNPKYTPRNKDKDVPFPITPWNLMREDSCLDGDFNVIGLWRGVRIELLEKTHLNRPYLFTEELTKDQARLHFEVEISDPMVDELQSKISDSTGRADFTFSFRSGNAGIRQDRVLDVQVEMTEHTTGNRVYSVTEPYSPFDWKKGRSVPEFYECHHYQREIVLKDPRVWMPYAMGTPELYDVRVALYENGALLDETCFQTGVRTVERDFSAGEKFRTRWDKFWFIINGERVFMEGVNWMPIDHFLILRREEYRWSLERARDMGVMIIRVWSGGGIPENDDFYELCDELGLMVWQDHPIANMETQNWDHDVLLNQVSMSLFRIRNHPSLVIHCGGNEFNPYALGNLASMSVIENAVADLDPSRQWVRTTPDRGSAHIYMDMEPTWYRELCRQLPFLAESGIHSFPTMKALKQVISQEEINRPLSNIFTKEFEKGNPELRNHFVEFIPERIPRMLSRASAIVDIEGVSLENLVEATQIASYEFYQTMIEALRENYPVTTGIMPWVYRRPSVAVGVQLMDGLGNPIAPFYAVKNAYRPLNVSLALAHATLKPGEALPLTACVVNGRKESICGLRLALDIYGPDLVKIETRARDICVSPEEDVISCDLGTLDMAEAFRDKYFFLVLTLSNAQGILARKTYWPRCLSLMEDAETLTQRRSEPVPNLFIRKGPWLKNQVRDCGGALLQARLLSQGWDEHRQWAEISLQNCGEKPAFPVTLDSEKMPCAADDQYFLLAAGEERRLRITFLRRGDELEKEITIKAWNCAPVTLPLSNG